MPISLRFRLSLKQIMVPNLNHYIRVNSRSVVYNCFFAETGQAMMHWHDIILHAVWKKDVGYCGRLSGVNGSDLLAEREALELFPKIWLTPLLVNTIVSLLIFYSNLEQNKLSLDCLLFWVDVFCTSQCLLWWSHDHVFQLRNFNPFYKHYWSY